MTHPPSPNHPLICNENPWTNNANSIWLGSTITLNRNLEKFLFPGKLSTDKRKQVISLISRELLASEPLHHPQLFFAEEMLPIEKEFLVEHFLSNQGFHQAYAGEAFVLDETGEFLAALNLRNHLLLQWTDPREELENSWDRLVKIELKLNQSLNFAFSPKFGFLTADPMQCGTGLNVTVFLHLPALLHSGQFEDIVKKNKDDGVHQTGLQGDPNEVVGDIVVFQNSHTLGVTEENILACLRTLATKLVAEEKSCRRQIKQEKESTLADVKDKVSRAYAVLLHSYQIEAIEALQALSWLKLGEDLGWMKGASQSLLNKLLFSCRRAHLLCLYAHKISQEELPHKRAEFIHKALQGVELLI